MLAGCWAHVLRRFEEATPDHPDAERRSRGSVRSTRSIERRRRPRAAAPSCAAPKAPAILDELKSVALERRPTLTSLSIGKAAAYTLGNWDRLTRFVDDARIPLDNNATERAIRGPVVGRKNHYGSKSRRGEDDAR